MKNPFAGFPSSLRTYLILGFAVVVLICMGTIITLSYLWMNGEQPFPNLQFYPSQRAPVDAGKGIGMEGAVCSGPERYPCAPGTKCSVSDADWGVEYGTCIPDPSGTRVTVPPEPKK